MARTYGDYISHAEVERAHLDQALRDSNIKNIIYYRGRLLGNLKRAYSINNSAVLPSTVTAGGSTGRSIFDEINSELTNHNSFLQTQITDNKTNTSHTPSISKEIAWKIRKLATNCSQVSFANNQIVRRRAFADVLRSSASLTASTVLKAPILVSSEVVSRVGNLAITIFSFPFGILESIFRSMVHVVSNNISSSPSYNEGYTVKIGEKLKEYIKDINEIVQKSVGRI